MDLKITRRRLDNHISYDWWKYIALIIAAIFFWSLLFTMLSPRLHNSKKMEIFFIIDGYDHTNSDRMRTNLRENLSDQFIEFTFSNYLPNETTTAQVLAARVVAGEGDLYVFPYTRNNTSNMFAAYINQGLFSDFESLIEDAFVFSEDIMEFEDFKKLNKRDREFNTDEKMQKGYQSYLEVRQRAKEHAQKLQGYIDDYADIEETPLFYKYAQSDEGYQEQIEEEKIWGLNFNALKNITDSSKGGFMYPVLNDDGTFKLPYYTMGITSFKKDNLPLYYENLAVINYFIETYYL